MSRETTLLVVICRICGLSVPIAICTVDESGKPVHEECYGKELLNRFNRSLSFPPKNESRGMEWQSDDEWKPITFWINVPDKTQWVH
jgi:hypothetical protein